ncbi:hypothetical protein [Rhodopila sp.]|uniref:hypothetical protein n=1 Tax=Rhodopila sp. TaxID=2480087 RepID=UPI003D10EC85
MIKRLTGRTYRRRRLHNRRYRRLGWIDRASAILGEERLAEFPDLACWFAAMDARPAVARARAIGKESRSSGIWTRITTAIEVDCPLLTYDMRIARFNETYGSPYGFLIAV